MPIAIRRPHELGTFREALATFVGNSSDLGDPCVIKSHGVLAQQLRRLVEELAVGRRRAGRERLRHDLVRHSEAGEETDLAALAVPLLTLRGREREVEMRQLDRTRTERVERSALDERLEHPLVAALEVDAA